MQSVWGVIGALAVVILPLALAGWLLGREDRARRRRQQQQTHAKMP